MRDLNTDHEMTLVDCPENGTHLVYHEITQISERSLSI